MAAAVAAPARETDRYDQPACLLGCCTSVHADSRKALEHGILASWPAAPVQRTLQPGSLASLNPTSTQKNLHPQVTYSPATALRSPAQASSTLLVTPDQEEVVCSTDLDEDGNCRVFVDRKGNMVEVSCRVLLSCRMHLLCGSHPPAASNVVPASRDCRRCAATTGSAATVAACTRRAMGRYQIQLSSW